MKNPLKREWMKSAPVKSIWDTLTKRGPTKEEKTAYTSALQAAVAQGTNANEAKQNLDAVGMGTQRKTSLKHGVGNLLLAGAFAPVALPFLAGKAAISMLKSRKGSTAPSITTLEGP